MAQFNFVLKQGFLKNYDEMYPSSALCPILQTSFYL